jgi:hypothetical protein
LPLSLVAGASWPCRHPNFFPRPALPLVLPFKGPNVAFFDPLATLPKCVADAKAAGAQIIIAVTHLGTPTDMQLAAAPALRDVDVYIGGHSHTLFYPGNNAPYILYPTPSMPETAPVYGNYPTPVDNGGKTVHVVQAYWASRCGWSRRAAEWRGTAHCRSSRAVRDTLLHRRGRACSTDVRLWQCPFSPLCRLQALPAARPLRRFAPHCTAHPRSPHKGTWGTWT